MTDLHPHDTTARDDAAVTAPALRAEGLAVEYGPRRRRVRAVEAVDLQVGPGEVLGLVGESGCGKSSLGRALVGLEPAATGSVHFLGHPVSPMTHRRRPAALRPLQMVFQDPYASLNPRRRVGDLIADGVRLRDGSRSEAEWLPGELLTRVGLGADAVERYPHEFSGGQRQRIAIARTLAARPRCIVADEPISALDASAQAQVANLLLTLAREDRMAMVFISHDLSVVRQIADRVAVMYLGRIVETGTTAAVWSQPAHPYTEALISAIPRADGAGTVPLDLPGDVPDPARPPRGCRFHPRCPLVQDRCATTVPMLATVPATVPADAPADVAADVPSEHAAACLVRVPTRS
ncbi:peptide/nickel transport system ATP-binding protein [Jatrophihabitans endophyticus]|uniref:Peptide/nickel transport system ATP-binding protein n=1 Tax=Jatrophihabitans endophyticus TaxID=1206085 RepID=A0A1M5PHB3_9ACTN|nr:ABC transporter ATP-binding protein [Jatrophihabitans endophyticus]SHH01214.1 peptide/nickel transport system ATP-binding protein [Jatrophihabitans endophyticus]